MKKLKEQDWFQILFMPKRGKLLTLIAWIIIAGIVYTLVTLL